MDKDNFDKNYENVVRLIKDDINKIEAAITLNDKKIMQDTHIKMVAKYDSYIRYFVSGMEYYDETYDAFDYYRMSKEALEHNLTTMQGKLEGFVMNIEISNLRYNSKKRKENEQRSLTQNIFNNTFSPKVENNWDMKVEFSNARKSIEQRDELEPDEVKEIQAKINELEKLNNNSKMTKQHKWPMVKKILEYALEKGVDVAMTIMGLVVKMNLGF